MSTSNASIFPAHSMPLSAAFGAVNSCTQSSTVNKWTNHCRLASRKAWTNSSSLRAMFSAGAFVFAAAERSGGRLQQAGSVSIWKPFLRPLWLPVSIDMFSFYLIPCAVLSSSHVHSSSPLRLFQMGGDLEDLEAALNKSSRSGTVGSGSCSALIKFLPGRKDLLVSHDTWNNYQSMLRILKRYSFAYRTSPTGVDLTE